MIPIHPFQTGDVLRPKIPQGKYAGEYEERISSTQTSDTKVGIPNKIGQGNIYFRTKYITVKIFNSVGYDYQFITNQ